MSIAVPELSCGAQDFACYIIIFFFYNNYFRNICIFYRPCPLTFKIDRCIFCDVILSYEELICRLTDDYKEAALS